MKDNRQMPVNNFNEAIARCKARGAHDVAKRIDIERQMVSALVRHALAEGMTVSVDDGGDELALEKSSSYADIFDAVGATDTDVLILHRADGSKVGWFQLIYGNDGYDVVADYGVNETTDHIWNTVVQPLADRLEATGR